MKEHDARAHEKHGIAMDRMAQKHEREVQIALDNDRIQMEGELRHQTRIARGTFKSTGGSNRFTRTSGID